jgi:hypothetical protein
MQMPYRMDAASVAPPLSCRHPSEGWDPALRQTCRSWIPAYAGMTNKGLKESLAGIDWICLHL